MKLLKKAKIISFPVPTVSFDSVANKRVPSVSDRPAFVRRNKELIVGELAVARAQLSLWEDYNSQNQIPTYYPTPEEEREMNEWFNSQYERELFREERYDFQQRYNGNPY